MALLRLGPLDETAVEPMRDSIRRTVGREVDRRTLRARVAASGQWTEHGAEFGFWSGTTVLGVVQGMCCPRWGDARSIEIGILVFDPEVRGRGIGTAALSLWLEHLLGERDAFRVSFVTQPGNERMIRLGQRCGFRFEGVVRGSVLIDDELHDELLYGLTREDARLVSS